MQREFADDRVAESFDAARVGAHVMPGPQLAEFVAAGGQLADELGQSAVEGAGDGAEVRDEVVGDVLPVRPELAGTRVEEGEPGHVRRAARVGEEHAVQGAGERIGRDQVQGGAADQRGDADEGVEDRLQLRGDRRRRGAAGAGRGGRPPGAREVEQVGLFGGVELQRAGDGLQDAVGGVGERAALQPDVVVDAEPGQGGDLLAAQPRHPPLAAGHRQPDRLWAYPRPAGGQKLRDLRPLIHVFQDMPR